jgi:hypothetical protein
VHPVLPVKFQVPEIVLPFTVPMRVSTLFIPESSVVMVIPNEPVTLPLELPISVKLPVSAVASDAKQGAVDVKVKFVTLIPLPLLWVKVVEKL